MAIQPDLTIFNPLPDDNDLFGFEIALSRGMLLVGAPGDDVAAGNEGNVGDDGAGDGDTGDDGAGGAGGDGAADIPGAGSAFVFDAIAGEAGSRLTDTSALEGDGLGNAVALSPDGSRALVGASSRDAVLDNGTVINSVGGAFLFSTTEGVLLAPPIENPTQTLNSAFGTAVALFSNNLAAISAPGETVGAVNNSGFAYIFDLGSGSEPIAIPNPDPDADASEAGEEFGNALAFGDGVLLVGAQQDDGAGNAADSSGAAYLFDSSTGNLLQSLFNPSADPEDLFGAAIAIDGDFVAVGAPGDDTAAVDAGAVYIYSLSGLLAGDTTPVQTLLGTNAGDEFGFALDLNGRRGIVLVGAPGVGSNAPAIDDSGEAFLIDIPSQIELQKFENPTPAAGERFGSSVAIDGFNIAIASPGDIVPSDGENPAIDDSGAVYTFAAQGNSAVSGFVFEDINGDGILQELATPEERIIEPTAVNADLLNTTEPVVYLDTNDNGTFDAQLNEPFVALDATGSYDFGSLPPGPYEVILGQQVFGLDAEENLIFNIVNDGSPTTPIDLAAEENLGSVNFGLDVGSAQVISPLAREAIETPALPPDPFAEVGTDNRIEAVPFGDSFSFNPVYATNTGDADLTGIVFEIYFDSTQVEFQGINSVFGDDRLTSTLPVFEDIVNNADNDLRTNAVIRFPFVDGLFFDGAFPGTADPVSLFNINFRTKGGFDITTGEFVPEVGTNATGPAGAGFILPPSRPGTPNADRNQLFSRQEITAELFRGTQINVLASETASGFNFAGAEIDIALPGGEPDDPNVPGGVGIGAFNDPNRFTYDVDGDGIIQALTDGVLIQRYLFNLTGDALTEGAIGTGATRDADAIVDFLNNGRAALDVDGDGIASPLTDAVALQRFFAGAVTFNGGDPNDVTTGIFEDIYGAGGTRTTQEGVGFMTAFSSSPVDVATLLGADTQGILALGGDELTDAVNQVIIDRLTV